MADYQENGVDLLASLQNGDTHAHSPNQLSESTAMPKHLAGRKQSSSKKFKIESVAASDDPLYNPNAAAATSAATSISSQPSTPNKQQRKHSTVDEQQESRSAPSSAGNRVEDEVYGGAPQFQSVEDLRSSKQRTSSIISTNDQRFFSVEDLNKDKPPTETCSSSASAATLDHSQCNVEINSDNDEVQMLPGEDGVAKPGSIHYSRRVGDSKLKFDDSFYKRATVEMRLNSREEPDPEAVTDIFVPVPMGPPSPVPQYAASHYTANHTASHEGNLHETITSAYETNLSINKLLRERHKGSLAAMGRIFGSKQREIEKQQPANSLMTSVSVKGKKRKCHWLQPVHIGLFFTFATIIVVTVVTLVMMERIREHVYAISGYHFNYKNRQMDVYSPLANSRDEIIFEASLGVNLGTGLPFNCSHKSDQSAEDESRCYKWHGTTTLRLTKHVYDASGLCLGVEWNTIAFDPMLEDCINLTDTFGYWYGGHSEGDALPLGDKDISFSSFLPGKIFGSVVERFWISTKGVAVVAKHDFPLHIRVESGEKPKICLSSWYGSQPGVRRLSYSICRADSHQEVQQMIMKYFYNPVINRSSNYAILSAPIFTSDGDDDILSTLSNHNLNYSYIIDEQSNVLWSNQSSGLPGVPENQLSSQISPFVTFSQSLAHVNSDVWIKSTDLDVPRLFNRDGEFYIMLNASSEHLSDVFGPPVNNLILVTDAAVGEVRGQQYYPIHETLITFQPYLESLITFLSNSTDEPVMSSVVSNLQKFSIILNLQPISDIRVTVKHILHSSLMGYNLINFGEIPGTLSTIQLIRTLQLAIFSPVVHFSQPMLKNFNNSAVMKSWKSCMDARKDLQVVEIIKKYLSDAEVYPLFTPVWWQNSDSDGFHVSDQFIFNKKYLVAPIFNGTSNSREVFFPNGVWVRDQVLQSKNRLDKGVIIGPKVVSFNVDMDEMLVFYYGGELEYKDGRNDS